jgi:magnesium-transporting ATPase (P-type)
MRKAGTAPATIDLVISEHGRLSSGGGKTMSVSQEAKTQPATQSGWYGSDVAAVARELGVEPEHGLSVEEARRRLQSKGPNRLTGTKKESGLQAFLRQYRDVMQLILLAAALVSLLVTGDVATAAVLAGLTACARRPRRRRASRRWPR